ncbi:helix-turn-helix domain-containing protein [Streptococcus sp. TATVAM-FAB35]|uniref:helix-turn-helix transcriptional regulator n=1 Tax=Streptococcus TaxID=1301 RepID=UPI00397F8D26
MDSVIQNFTDWLKGIIKETLNKLLEIERDDGFNELMTPKETCEFLGVSYDTFQTYRYMDGFPKELPAKRWSKRAIKKWLENQI